MPSPQPKRHRLTLGRLFDSWLEQHGRAAVETIDHLLRTPLATLMTVAAIAIAIALPAALYVLTENLKMLGGSWEQTAAISLFLKPEVDEQRAAALAARLRARSDITAVEVVSREAGLAEFKEYSGLAGALEQLHENPLPVVLAIYPVARIADTPGSSRLTSMLEALPESDFARIDTQWTKRFRAIVELLQNGVLLFGGILALGVLLVVGNTIRLEIENRRAEIEVMDLVGATAAFIRRPLLYSGAWYGLLGGIVAWLMVALTMQALQAPVDRLAALYHTEFRMIGLGARPSLLLLGASVALGVLGSWIAVGRHLTRVDPL